MTLLELITIAHEKDYMIRIGNSGLDHGWMKFSFEYRLGDEVFRDVFVVTPEHMPKADMAFQEALLRFENNIYQ